jgi:hypothetical protein
MTRPGTIVKLVVRKGCTKANALYFLVGLLLAHAFFTIYSSTKLYHKSHGRENLMLSGLERMSVNSIHGRSTDTWKHKPPPVGEAKMISETETKTETGSPYAYVFTVGGVNEKKPGYRGFLLNILIATRILANEGSTADVIAYFQMSPASDLDKLPEEDQRLLSRMNVHVKYLPKPKQESFYDIVFEKFRCLELVQYRRALFLDADVIPLHNIDYIFKLSEGDDAILKENMIVATRGEPCNAGFFMLKPGKGEWDQLQRIVKAQLESAKDLPHPKFDKVKGWGHSFIAAKDNWEAITKKGNRYVP